MFIITDPAAVINPVSHTYFPPVFIEKSAFYQTFEPPILTSAENSRSAQIQESFHMVIPLWYNGNELTFVEKIEILSKGGTL